MLNLCYKIAAVATLMTVVTPFGLSAQDPDSAGVLSYFKEEGKIWVLLGYDGKDGVWRDFGGGRAEVDQGDLKATAMRELKEETRRVYGDEVGVTLQGPLKRGRYLQYFAEVPFRPVSVFMKSNPQTREVAENEMTWYMWIPLEALFAVVNDRPKNTQQPYRDINLPDEYIPLGVRLYGNRHQPPRRYLHDVFAATIDKLRNNPNLREKYLK